MLTREDMSEIAVVNIRVDRMAQRLRGRHPLIGEALLDAGDSLAEAGSLMEYALLDSEAREGDE